MNSRPATPVLGRRLLCLIYEALLLTAVILTAGGLATVLAQIAGINRPRILTQVIVVIVCAGYYAVQWQRRGQTLPMKTWRIRLESTSGDRITPLQALLRMTLAAAERSFLPAAARAQARGQILAWARACGLGQV